MKKLTVAVYNKAVEHKPKGKDVGKHKFLRNQISEPELELQELLDLIIKGHSFHPGRYKYSDERPAYKETYRERTFCDTNLIVVDIDEGNLTIDAIMKKSGRFIPSVIYSTSNYTEENRRYRVMYIMDRYLNREETIKVKMYFTKILGGDEACMKTAAFMYFGGKAILYNEPSIVASEDVLCIPEVNEYEIKKLETVGLRKKIRSSGTSEVQECIHDSHEVLRSISQLSFTNKPDKIYVSDSYEYINSLDLTQILGVQEESLFRCIMPGHDDRNPSANIIYSKGKYMYKCHSTKCVANRAINNIDVMAFLLNLEPYKMAKVILDVLEIELTSPYREQVKSICENNKKMIDFLSISKLFSNHSGQKFIQSYRLFMDYIIYNTTPFVKDYQEKNLKISASQRHIDKFMKEKGCSGDTCRRLNRLAGLNLIHKICLSDVPDSQQSQIKLLQDTHKRVKHITIWEIQVLEHSRLDDAVSIETQRKNEGYLLRGSSSLETAHFMGRDKAKEIYNQEKVEISEGTEVIVRRIMKELIDEKGWFLKSQIISEFPDDKKKAEMYKKYLNKARLNEGITVAPLNSKLRSQYSIGEEVKSRTHIYFKV